MKPCRKCGDTKPLSEFYRHAQMSDGHVHTCKPCMCAMVRAAREQKLDAYRAYDRQRHRTPKRRQYARMKTDEHRRAHPEKTRARRMVRYRVARGMIVPQPCEVGGACFGIVQAHHEDYSRPLDVRWLCARHHADVHVGRVSLPAHAVGAA
jgi:hypothetical protein